MPFISEFRRQEKRQASRYIQFEATLVYTGSYITVRDIFVRFCPSTSTEKRRRIKEKHTEENYPVCSLCCIREEKCIWVRWMGAGRSGGRGNWSK